MRMNNMSKRVANFENRNKIKEFLLQGKSFKEMTEKLNLKEETIKYHVTQIYKQHNVTSGKEFVAKFGDLKNIVQIDNIAEKIAMLATLTKDIDELKVAKEKLENDIKFLYEFSVLVRYEYEKITKTILPLGGRRV